MITKIESNDFTILTKKLIDFLFFQDVRSFQRRLVIVPDLAFKDFLLRQFLLEPSLQMFAGVEILQLNQAVATLFESIEEQRKVVPSFVALSLAIEEKLFNSQFIERSLLLSKYLSGSHEKKERRRIALSDHLAHLFSLYGLYGCSFLRKWENAQDGDFQKELWKEVFCESSSWCPPLHALKEGKPLSSLSDTKIALFGFSYLPIAHLDFFSRMNAHLFHFSFSFSFWEDFLSDKERFSLYKKVENEKQLEELEQYLEENHPLLSNWGKLAKEMLKNLGMIGLIENQELEVYKEREDTTLLASLKNGMLTLEAQSLCDVDDSIQIHSAPSKLREVEALLEQIHNLLKEHSGWNLSDFLILSPSISSYAPYIEMVFGQTGLSYVIDGLELKSVSLLAQGFCQLIDLPLENYSLQAVFSLFENSSFLEKQMFRRDEVDQLHRWFELAEIHEHLEEGINSWEAGIFRLLQGYALIPQSDWQGEYFPIKALGWTDIDLLNRFLTLFFEIQEDLNQLLKPRCFKEWLLLFLSWINKYFSVSLEKDLFAQELQREMQLNANASVFPFSFTSIRRVLDHICMRKKGRKKSGDFNQMTFTSMELGKIVPHRFIACLGLSENAFPKLLEKIPLCALQPTDDYFPTSSDEDKAAFLQLLLQAEDYLILSYERIHPEDHQVQFPSLLIEELDQYVKKEKKSGLKRVHHLDINVALSSSHHSVFFSEKIPLVFQASFREIAIKDLKKFARHPIAFYFQKSLGLFLREKGEDNEKEFFLSHLDKGLLRKNALKKTVEKAVGEIKARGKLPKGIFETAALHVFEQEMQDFYTHLGDFSLSAEEIGSFFLTPGLQENRTHFPPLSIMTSFGQVQIIGELSDVSCQGLLFHGENDLKSWLQCWPLYLIYCCLCKENQKLLLTKDGSCCELLIEDPLLLLKHYIEYFLTALEKPSPLMPYWAKPALTGSRQELLKALQNTVQRSTGIYAEDPYFSYLNRRGSLEELVESLESWQPLFKAAFEPLNLKRGM